MKRELDFLVVGNVGIDTNVYLHGESIDFSAESNFTDNRDNIGQAGGYTARGFSRLGMRTGFLGYVGDDPMGEWIRSAFLGEGISDRGLLIDPAGTSRSINIVNRGGQRKNFYDGKGHMTLMPSPDQYEDLVKNSTHIHFHLPNWARNIIPAAQRYGATLSCDLQDITDINDPYREDFIRGCRILFFSSANHEDPGAIMRHVLQHYPDKILVSGMGARGAALGTSQGIRYFSALSWESPVVDTNGAGDSLAVGFLTSHLVHGMGLEASILRGQIAARHACTLKGTSSGLITWQELQARAGRIESSGQ